MSVSVPVVAALLLGVIGLAPAAAAGPITGAPIAANPTDVHPTASHPTATHHTATHHSATHRTGAAEVRTAKAPTVAPIPLPGSFQTLTPARLLDTRTGIGGVQGIQPANGSVAVQILGRGGVPAGGVSAVVLSVSVVRPTSAGYLTAGPDGASRPAAGHLNWSIDQTVAGTVVVPVGVDRMVRLYTVGDPGQLHLVADVTGYYAAGSATTPGAFQPLPLSARIVNTIRGIGLPAAPLPSRGSVPVQVTGKAGIPATGVSAVALTITVTRASSSGHLGISPSDLGAPVGSIISYVRGRSSAAFVIVPVGPDGKITVWSLGVGNYALMVDVAGWFVAGSTADPGSFQPLPAARVADSRVGRGITAGPLPAAGSTSVQVAGVGGVPARGVTAVQVSVTATGATGEGWVSLASGPSAPLASSLLNFGPIQTMAASMLVPVGRDGRIQLSTAGRGTVQLIVEVAGYVLAGPPRFGLSPGQTLASGASLRSPSGQLVLWMRPDGDLAMTAQGSMLWHSNTGGLPGARATMQRDGNLVITAPDTGVLWASGTSAHPWATLGLSTDGTARIGVAGATLWSTGVVNSTLTPVHWLQRGWTLFSANGAAHLTMQTDGNLVMRNRSGRVIWSSGTGGRPGAHAVQQGGGALVIYQGTKAIWHSPTTGSPGARTMVRTDGRLTVTASNGVPLWWPGRTASTAPSGCAGVPPDPSGSAITRWHPVELCVLASLGQSPGDLSDVDIMIRWESGGDPNAVNNYDSNAQAGHPSKGLIQVIKPTFDYYRSDQLPNDLLNPAANLYAGLNYAVHTYGSIHNVPGLVSLRSGGPYVGYKLSQ